MTFAVKKSVKYRVFQLNFYIRKTVFKRLLEKKKKTLALKYKNSVIFLFFFFSFTVQVDSVENRKKNKNYYLHPDERRSRTVTNYNRRVGFLRTTPIAKSVFRDIKYGFLLFFFHA